MTVAVRQRPQGEGTTLADLAPWMERAKRQIGTRELVHGELNPLIRKWFVSATPFPLTRVDARTPWCAAFACAMLEDAGVQSPHSARARDFLAWGVPLVRPVFGAIMVFQRGAPQLGQGHVCFCDLTPTIPESRAVIGLGGNQRNAVCTVVHPTASLLGVRWPDTWPLPEGAELIKPPEDDR